MSRVAGEKIMFGIVAVQTNTAYISPIVYSYHKLENSSEDAASAAMRAGISTSSA